MFDGDDMIVLARQPRQGLGKLAVLTTGTCTLPDQTDQSLIHGPGAARHGTFSFSQSFPACDFRPENTLVLISHFANSLCIMLSRIPYLTTWANGVARHGTCSRCSNSRPCECDSSWIAHFDGDRLIRHHRDVEKGLRCGLLGPEPARFRRSSACFGS